jgi:hypothetical protein
MFRRKIIRYEDEALLLEEEEEIEHDTIAISGSSGTIASPSHNLLSSPPASATKRPRPSYGTNIANLFDKIYIKINIFCST